MATLVFTVTPEHRYTKTVDEGTEYDHLANLFMRRPPYDTRWLLTDEDVWLRSEAIVSVEIVQPGRSIAA